MIKTIARVSNEEGVGFKILRQYLLPAFMAVALMNDTTCTALVAEPWTANAGMVGVKFDGEGNYSVTVGGEKWLENSETALHCDGKWFSNSGRSDAEPLVLKNSKPGSGYDKLGAYDGIEETWEADRTLFVTSCRLYKDGTLSFEQSFPKGAKNVAVDPTSSLKKNAKNIHEFKYDGVASAFPSFKKTGKLSTLHYLTFHEWFANPVHGRGLDKFPGGVDGGVPVALFDDNLRTVIISPLTSFKAAYQAAPERFGGDLVCGVPGLVEEIPAGFSIKTIIHTAQGVNATFESWGDKLLNYYDKDGSWVKDDFAAQHLGYWTDNGAYYYYHTIPGKNYEETLLDLRASHQAEGIPFRYYQLDSWWYFRGPTNGVTLWEPRPDIFPSGLDSLHKKIGTDFVMHNRYWDPATSYTAKYNFIVEKLAACPMDEKFWDKLFSGNKEKGCIVYEQDWLNSQLSKTDALLTSTHLAYDWLSTMARSAEKQKLPLQYCMALPSDFLQSAEFPAVTEIRVSGDYRLEKQQWKIGATSMLAHALRMAPFKDTFWTSDPQTDSKYKDSREWNCELQTLVSALSAGPVGPGDKIGAVNKDLIMRVCQQDGLLLKPDKPATPVDSTLLADGTNGEIWSTYSDFGGARWHYLFAAQLAKPVTLSVKDFAGVSRAVVLDYRLGTTREFDKDHPLEIASGDTGNTPVTFSYYVIAPQTKDGAAFLGEIGKFVTASKTRFVTIKAGGLDVTAVGVPRETLELYWLLPSAPKSVKAGRTVLAKQDTVSANGLSWSYDGTTGKLKVKAPIGADGSLRIQVVR